MTFLAPGFLVAAGLMAAVVIALHFIVSRDPRSVFLPTARFAPERPARARAQALRLQDVLLMLLRVALVLAVGAALARPVVHPPGRALARVVMADRSRSVASAGEVADSVRALLAPNSTLVAFDSAAEVVPAADSIGMPGRSSGRGRISAALVVALRAASRLSDEADSLELVLVSPFTAEEIDDATDSIRALWPGSIRLVPVAARHHDEPPPAIEFRGGAADPLRLALPVGSPGAANVRVVRDAMTAADTAWVTAGERTLVLWPVASDATSGARSTRAAPDTVGAVVAGGSVVVAPFARTVASGSRPPGGSRIVARWVDGEPAAIETPLGGGCLRSVAVPVTAIGDLVLQRRFGRLVATLTAPCGSFGTPTPLDSVERAVFAGGGRAPTSSTAIGRREEVPTPLARWLLALALLLAGGEWLLRRSIASPANAGASP
jgi:hypothetical protein